MLDSLPAHSDVIIIGAGPAGTAMASYLADRGVAGLIIERAQFPRFSIGESLLPEAINCLETAGLLDAVEAGGFQYKDGALFATNHAQCTVNFADGFSPGRHYAYQVPRDDFDLRLANCCTAKGVRIAYQISVVDIVATDRGYRLTLESGDQRRTISANFLVDASGFGRVLANRFNLAKAPTIAGKKALFCHIQCEINDTDFDRNKILIAQTEVDSPTWYWLIPFTGGSASVGVVSDDKTADRDAEEEYLQCLAAQRLVAKLTADGALMRPVGCISGYGAGVASLYGERYVILGNAGEFIDPIFSSGVTIALKSAVLAAPLVLEAITQNEAPDWHGRFQAPLMEGVDTFKEFVLAWYAGIVPNLLYSPNKNDDAYRMICGVLAGYVWDRSNPFTRMTVSRLESLLRLSRESG